MFVPELNTDTLAAALERLKAQLPPAAREAVRATAQESLKRIAKPTYWRNGGSRGKRTADTFRVSQSGDYAASVSSNSVIAAYLNDGTKRHVIAAKNAKALCFVQNGAKRFAKRVMHPGTKPLNYEATETRLGQKDLEDFGDGALRRAVERSGLG